MPNYARLDALINSSAVQDQLEALMEIQALIPLECEDDSSKLTSFANFLRLPFGSSSDPQVLAHASRALGQLAQLGGNEAVEPELKRALQRLKVCNRLDSAVLVVKELAQHAPTLIYVHVADVIEHIWAAIRDSRVPVREGAARALCACLELMAGRESRSRAKWYDRVYEEARAGFDAGSVEAVHGALLTTTELLGESGAPLSEAKLRDVFDLAWAHREHREKLVRRAVVALVPKLAEHCARSPHAGALFVQTYLSMTIAHLLNTLRTSSSDLREAAFLAIGDTAIATSRCPRRALLSSASVASGGGRSPDAGGPSADAPPLPRSPSPKAPKAATADEKAAKGVGWLLRGYNRSSAATPASLRPPVDYPPLSPRSSDGDGGSRVGRRYSASHPFLPFVAGVLKEVRESLTPSKRGPSKRAAYCAEAIVCVAKLAEALGEELEPQCEDLYPHLFSHGLSEKLRASLVLMATHIPSQLHALQRRVLDAVCLVLARCPFSEWQRLSPHERASGCAAAASESHDDAAVAQQVTLALQTLGAFNEGDWSGQPQVLAFVHECASCFLDSDEVHVRRAAAEGCCRLLLHASQRSEEAEGEEGGIPGSGGDDELPATLVSGSAPSSSPGRLLPPAKSWKYAPPPGGSGSAVCDRRATSVVAWPAPATPRGTGGGGGAGLRERQARLCAEILQKVLIAGVVDPDGEIRQLVWHALGTCFDTQLAHPDALRCIFMALNDQIFSIRRATISTLGRLCRINPAHVMPSMRAMLMQLLTQLEYSTSAQQREESAMLLAALIEGAQELIQPHATAVLQALRPRLADPSASVAASVLSALGCLVLVGGESMRQLAPLLLAPVVDALRDESSHARRRSALTVLAQLVRATGDSAAPYAEYPELLPTLLALLRSERQPEARADLLRALGVLGALDPVTQARMRATAAAAAGSGDDSKAANESSAQPNLADPEFYHTAAVSALTRVLRDPSRSKEHREATQALIFICTTLGVRSARYLPHVVPLVARAIEAADVRLREFLLQQLGVVVGLVKGAIRPHVPTLLALIRRFWKPGHESSEKLQGHCVELLDRITVALGGDFKFYLPELLPMLLAVFHGDRSASRLNTRKVLKVLEAFGDSLDDFLYMVVPALIQLLESPDAPVDVRKDTLARLGSLCNQHDLATLASPLVHSLVFVLGQPELSRLFRDAVTTLYSLAFQLGADYLIFAPTVGSVLRRSGVRDEKYERLVLMLTQDEPVRADPLMAPEGHRLALNTRRRHSSTEIAETAAVAAIRATGGGASGDAGVAKRFVIDQRKLARAWDARHRATTEDWSDWMRAFALELLRESPSQALRACAALAERNLALSYELLNPAFFSCWEGMSRTAVSGQAAGEQPLPSIEALVASLQMAMESEQMPAQLLQLLLNLAEFMERAERPLGIAWRSLAKLAGAANAFAKGLHYTEHLHSEGHADIASLISLNGRLGQHDAAKGILTAAEGAQRLRGANAATDGAERTELGAQPKELTFDLLATSPELDWKRALHAYEVRQEEQPDSVAIALGRMRCLASLGRWASLSALCEETRRSEQLPDERSCVAAHGATAALNLAVFAAEPAAAVPHWRAMRRYVEAMRPGSFEASVCSSILALRAEMLDRAQAHVEAARRAVDAELTALVEESYERAYPIMVRLQQLAELEEVIAHRRSPAMQSTAHLVRLWRSRLQRCEASVDVWKQLIPVHTLAVPPTENLEGLLKFAHLCQDNQRPTLALHTLRACGAPADSPSGDASSAASAWLSCPVQVALAYLCHTWDDGQRAPAVEGLRTFLALHGRPRAGLQTEGRSDGHVDLAAKGWIRLGEWERLLLAEEGGDFDGVQLQSHFQRATQLDPSSYLGWHALAMVHFEIAQTREQKARLSDVVEAQSAVAGSAVPAIQAFFKCIALGASGRSLQDILRLLTLWFKHGSEPCVDEAIAAGVEAMSVDTWLAVTPQIIARIHHPDHLIRRAVRKLLAHLGQAHPQGIVYPLTVAAKAHNPLQHEGAKEVLDRMRLSYDTLVQHAELVSAELIRSSILWSEMWQEALEEASRIYFGSGHVDEMLRLLAPLHRLIERGPETLSEVTFKQAFGGHLRQAHEWGVRCQRTRDRTDLNAAWDLYYHVFRKINKQAAKINALELGTVSPRLLDARELEVAVPGTYTPSEPIVRIRSFAPSMVVITSKQRPRKISLEGGDGAEHTFLLKGHEDLRQDERVMQLFGLVNSLLVHEHETRSELSIHRYSVIPLSPNSGLIRWVPNCDTLHSLVQEYRQQRNIPLKIEHQLMCRMAPNSGYDLLPLVSKVEVFENALHRTTGKDLQQVLWLKSVSAERWLERRTNFTRSLAAMSMVGYILGLGDRHLSNLMLERFSGKVLHIDFGDCFEVAIHRDKFPETVPFRLTRMLVNAMGVSGTEGNFRCTCESVMGVLRRHKDSVMAMLEAFLHDPLINWGVGVVAKEKDARAGQPAPAEDAKPAADFLPMQVAARMDRNIGSVIEPSRHHHAGFFEDTQKDDHLIDAQAIKVVRRVKSKLAGAEEEFKPHGTPLVVSDQVARLIHEAQKIPSLAVMYQGWCPWH